MVRGLEHQSGEHAPIVMREKLVNRAEKGRTFTLGGKRGKRRG